MSSRLDVCGEDDSSKLFAVFDKKKRSFHLNTHTGVFLAPFPPQKAGGPWTVAVCQPSRTLNVKEKNAWERRFALRLSKRPTKSEVEFLFFQPSYWQRRWEAKTLEQETTFQLSLGIRPTQWKLWRSCTPERLEGRISCVIGGIYTLPVKNRGPRRRYQLLWGSGGRRGESGKQQRAEGPRFNRGASQPIGKEQLKQ